MPGATPARPRQAYFRQLRTDHALEPGAIAPAHTSRQYAPFNGHASRSRQQPERSYGATAAGYPNSRRFITEHTSAINSSASGSFTDSHGRGGGVSADATSLHTRGGGYGPAAEHQELRAVPEATSVSRQPAQSDHSISAYLTTLGRGAEVPAPFPAPSVDASNEAARNREDMVNDDPRNPYKNHRNSVFYNTYPSSGRSAGRTRRPPGTGYGTRYFQNGMCPSHIETLL